MDKKQEILKRLKQIARENGPFVSLLATVKSVNASEYTCVLYDEDSEAEFEDVRLRPVLDGNESITIIPKVGTWVSAIRIEDEDDWLLVAAGEIDKYKIKIGDTILEITSVGVVFNGGNFGGVPKAESVAGRLNLIENKINSLITNFTLWVPAFGDGGTALKTQLTEWLTTQLAQTNKEQIENNKLKH